jgi:hypothetical protein
MSLEKLNDFGGYKKSLELFDGVVDDMKILRPYPETHRLISQQIASADSICSNMIEKRIALCDEIIGILTSSINKLRNQ